jgi:hypothetical protein
MQLRTLLVGASLLALTATAANGASLRWASQGDALTPTRIRRTRARPTTTPRSTTIR